MLAVSTINGVRPALSTSHSRACPENDSWWRWTSGSWMTPATPRPRHSGCKAIDNQSQTVAHGSHDHLRLPGSEYFESERRHRGGRSLSPCGPFAPPDHDKLREMLRNRVWNDPRPVRLECLRRPGHARRRRIGVRDRKLLAFSKKSNKNNLKSAASRRL